VKRNAELRRSIIHRCVISGDQKHLVRLPRNTSHCPQAVRSKNGIRFGNAFIRGESIRTLRKARMHKHKAWYKRLFARRNSWVRNGKYKPFTEKFDRCVDYQSNMPSQAWIERMQHDLQSQPRDIVSNIQGDMDVALRRIANDCAISVVVDCSGSMVIDERYKSCAMLAVLLGRIFAKYDIAYEILGFNLIKGSSQSLYETSGNPDVGRVGDVHHRIFKSFEHKLYEPAIAGIYDAICKPDDERWGNVDGEALVWAYHRIKKRHEGMRFILMLTDGNPAGEEANDSDYSGWQGSEVPHYFSSHLISIRNQIEKSHVMVIGVGIGSDVDVNAYYKNTLKVKHPKDLAPSIIGFLQMIALQS